MNRTLRLAVLPLAAVAALAFAGTALATQRIAVSQTSTSLTIKVSQDQSDVQPAKIQIYVPSGYTPTLGAAPGTKIGTTTGHVFARDVGVPLPLEGDVIVDDPAKHTKDACSPGTNAAVWLLNLSVAGQTINLPVYVNPTSAAESSLGALKLTVCLGPADVPTGTPGRSPNGAQLLDATFTVNNTLTPPSGPVTWISFWTPYKAGTPAPDPGSTVEARSLVGPGTVTLRAKILNKKKKIVRLSGVVTQAGNPVSGAKAALLINSHPSSYSLTSNASGGFGLFLRQCTKPKPAPCVTPRGVRTTFFQMVATAAARDITSTGCATPTQPPIPCVSATAGPFTARSAKIKVRI
jgi:hypothetical protein